MSVFFSGAERKEILYIATMRLTIEFGASTAIEIRLGTGVAIRQHIGSDSFFFSFGYRFIYLLRYLFVYCTYTVEQAELVVQCCFRLLVRHS